MGKTNFINVGGGIALMLAGVFLASPADEAITTVASGGATVPLLPLQLGGTAVLGTMMMLGGFGIVEKEFSK